LEEEERVKRLGYDKIKDEEEAKKIKEREAEERRQAKASAGLSAGADISRGSTPVSSRAKDEAPKPARLGFGQVIGAATQPVVKA
jgi:ADP-ribosylation factor GTPase-activating protein 2/3